MRLRFALLSVLALAAALPAASLAAEPPRAVNLDADPELETVLDRELTCFGEGGEHPGPCAADEAVVESQVTIVDVCAGVERRFDLFREPQGRVNRIAVLEADGDRSRPELLVDGRSGAAGYIGEVAVVRLDGGGAVCARPRVLFRHPGARTRRPRGAFRSVTGFVRARDYRRDVRGRELRLDQSWYRAADPGCCPTWNSIRFFRYSAERDRYVPYRAVIRRLPRSG